MTQNRVGKMQLTVKHYYNVNKILMSKMGTWPTQSTFKKIALPTLTTTVIFSIGFLEFVRMTEIWHKLMEDCECFIIVLLSIGGYIKIFLVVLKNKNIEYLLSLINYHWRIFTHSLEVKAMEEYAILGRKMTIIYAVMIYSLMSIFMLMPLMPQLLDLLMPLNTSRPRIYLFDIDYSFDRDEYFYPVLFHSYTLTVLSMTAMVIVDTSYLMFTLHACGLFASIGHRLENLTSMTSVKKNNFKDVICNKRKDYDDEIYRELVLLLRKHQLSLTYVDLLESFYALYSFSMIFLHFIIMTLLGMQIMSLKDQKQEMIKFVSMGLGGFVHLFVLSYPAQEIMDHSADIFHKAYNMLWYKMSRRTVRLLSILLYRAFVPCTLTAGKIYVLSIENYVKVRNLSNSCSIYKYYGST
ncbi:PREDICTED: uncharacterized protein LOC105462966 [Wasmannia auropunctata]|uniref:uncharacterized protein LOC105462966 n=1 Tax=Wasmannia auropunctata TaxID=64793 RepID=UPI0005EF1355|nr:PREDICTED: uncharacterized protein LOC105462966 [Wasmannia auropunctata]